MGAFCFFPLCWAQFNRVVRYDRRGGGAESLVTAHLLLSTCAYESLVMDAVGLAKWHVRVEGPVPGAVHSCPQSHTLAPMLDPLLCIDLPV